MGRSQKSKSKDNKRNARNEFRRATPKSKSQPSFLTDLARVDFEHLRLAKFISIGAIVIVVLGLGYFFMSDIRDNLVARASISHPSQIQSITPVAKDDDVSSNDSKEMEFSVTDMDGVTVNVDRKEMQKYLDNMSDEEFKAFFTTLLRHSMTESNRLAKPTDADKDGVVVSDTDKPLYETLEEAYAEAERRYPNQIDGSKRLKLIRDLNAKDFKYYVAENGDTLLALSQAFQVPLGELVELNGIHDADKIPAGMILLFPLDTKQPDLPDGDAEK